MSLERIRKRLTAKQILRRPLDLVKELARAQSEAFQLGAEAARLTIVGAAFQLKYNPDDPHEITHGQTSARDFTLRLFRRELLAEVQP